MYQLLESIRIENACLQLIDYHNRRFNQARKMLMNMHDELNLEDIISIPAGIGTGLYKCRVLSDGNQHMIEINPYSQRTIRSLRVIKADDIDYTFKTTERSGLDKLFAMRGSSDDIIIVKNEMVTDSWAANLVFFDGQKWYTPNTPLLKGVQREYLLSSGLITEKSIPVSEITQYTKVKLINAMLDFHRAPELDVETAVFY